MLDLDQRVVEGLHELARRAPVDADVWAATEKHVGERRRARRALAVSALTLVVLAGGLAAVEVARPGEAKRVVASHGAVGVPTIEITAAPTGGLTYDPPEISVRTGLYDVVLKDGANAAHTLDFADSTTRFPGLFVNRAGETQAHRVFFGRAGDYTFFCAIPGHRAAGETGVVHVTGPDLTLEQAAARAGLG